MSASQSALSRFPPEVLGECFLSCVDDRLPTIALDEAPVSLTLVCRSWHNVALTTPRLWARLSIEIWNLEEKRLERILSQMSKLLERSMAMPLTCSLRFFDDCSRSDEEVDRESALCRPIIELLLQHAHRWSDVVIQSPDYVESLTSPLTVEAIPFPNLRRLSLWGIDTEQLTLSLTPEQTPLLEALVVPSSALRTWSLNWSQLLSLHILDHEDNPEYLSVVFAILPCCSQLRELRVQCHCFETGEVIIPLQNTGRTVVLPHLTYLSLATNRDDLICAFTDKISAPALITLFLEGFDARHAPRSVISFLEHHSKTIETFDLGPRCKAGQTGLASLWKRLPNMKHLRLHHDASTGDILRSLIRHYRDKDVFEYQFLEELSMDVTPDILEPDVFRAITKHLQAFVYLEQYDTLGLKSVHFRIACDAPGSGKHDEQDPHVQVASKLTEALERVRYIGLLMDLDIEFVDKRMCMKEQPRDGTVWTLDDPDAGYYLEHE